MLNYGAIFYIIGWLVAGYGLVMFLPAGVSLIYGEDEWLPFAISALFAFFVGGNMLLINRGSPRSLSHRDGFLLTFLAWLILGLLGALPLYFSGAIGFFVDAVFESFSGLTTTGATVMSGLDTTAKGILFWRTLMQWMGGMGIIVLAIAILPFLGVGGMQLYKSEMPGVVKDKLQPRLQETAKLLWVVYLFLTVLCCVAYAIAGMSVFDAICHAFTTVATAGFANYDASFAAFNSTAIELIAIVFMFIGGINFALHFVFLGRGRLSVYVKDDEFRWYTCYLLVAFLAALLMFILSGGLGDVRVTEVLFNIVSMATTTGFVVGDYSLWPGLIPMLIVILMFHGGSTGSTVGGLKVMRVMLVMKQGQREIKRLLHPHSVQCLKVDKKVVSDDILQTVWSFIGLYFFTFVVITLLLSAMGIDIVTAFSAVAATITSAGPALGEVGPGSNYAGLPALAKVLLCASMLLGRLELFTVLLIFSPQFWRR